MQKILDLEKWQRVPGFPNYEVSTKGRLRHHGTLIALDGPTYKIRYGARQAQINIKQLVEHLRNHPRQGNRLLLFKKQLGAFQRFGQGQAIANRLKLVRGASTP